MVWKIDNPQGNEAAKVKYEVVEYTRGRGLDLGCGPFKLYSHFTGVDNGHHWGTQGADIVQDCETLDMFASQSCDFVFSSHLLEHIEDYKAALKEWWRVIKPGGHLILYLPHKEFYPNVGQEGANPDHKHDFMPEDITKAMRFFLMPGWDLIVNEERNQDQEYSFLQVYKKGCKGHRQSCQDKQPKKRAAVVRYGGFGDMIQASSILPGLKAQGYHITFYTTPRGQDVLKNDPHIDKFFIQDPDQVPNGELHAFWAVQAKRYHKFINLSESVEGTFLALPGRTKHLWPADVKHKMMNVNYLEFTHALAGVPMPPKQRFFPTDHEIKWAKKERKKINGRVIMWALAGSSVHKTWPWIDQAFARFMLMYPDVHIITAGNDVCQILEQGWENEPRVIYKSGKWSIRETLTMAGMVDMVVGPETGVLNTVGMMDIPKIVFLSHSSVENLSKHWQNTVSLEPDCKCYPCHTLHYGWQHCNEYQESGVSECQASITCDSFMDAVNKFFKR
jgi:ADP-heptose:LPS heptosyltransferase/predicted SAM-dependent methyltransferase